MNTDFKSRYDSKFGNGTFDKLNIAKKKYYNDSFIRINISKIKVEDVEIFLKNNNVTYSNTYIPNCLKIEKSFFNLSSSLLALEGKIYLQDIASQVSINCIDLKSYENKNIKILDACASPGSKTSQMCDLLNFNKINYEIVALEPNEKRINRLINNLQKQKFENVKIINSKAQNYNTDDKFDLILVDAPCSGNLVGDRDWLQKRDIKGIKDRANEQKEILRNVIKYLSKNGILIYSTCSLEWEENEENVNWIKDKLNLENIKPYLKLPFETKSLNKDYSIRFMPYLSKSQGFFVCLFKNK